MRIKPLLVILLCVSLAACGGRRAENPDGTSTVSTVDDRPFLVRVFGRRAGATASPVGQPLIPQVTDLLLERRPGGVIVHATGLSPRQGYFDARLVATNSEVPENGVLTYRFQASPPPGATRVSTVRSREIEVALFVSDQTIVGVREIRVLAAENGLSRRAP